MAKNRIKRFASLSGDIVIFIRKNPRKTIHYISKGMRKQGYSVTWETVKSYLLDLKAKKKIKSIDMGGMVFWDSI